MLFLQLDGLTEANKQTLQVSAEAAISGFISFL